MASKRNIVLASLVSIVLMLALAAGMAPTLLHGSESRARAAQGADGIAVSVDGVSPVGGAYQIPVGSEQGFTALGLVDGVVSGMLPAGVVEWSLAAPGTAVLASAPGDVVATVSALAPGRAWLYAATVDGQVDTLELVFSDLKSAGAAKVGALSEVWIQQPSGARVVKPTGAVALPLAVAADTNARDDTQDIAFTWDGGGDTVAAFPYVATIADMDAVTSLTATATSLTVGTFEDSNTWTLEEADATADGLPADPFGLDLAEGDLWVSQVTVGLETRFVQAVGLEALVGKSRIPVLEDGTAVVWQDPLNPLRAAVITAPAGLVQEGEQGLLVLMAADSVEALVGPALAARVAADPGDGLVMGAAYLLVDLLIKEEGAEGWVSVDPARLAETPIQVTMSGLGVIQGANARYFTFPAAVVEDGGAPALAVPEVGGAWAPTGRGTVVDDNLMTAELTSLSIIAPFVTSNMLHITSIQNATLGGAQDFAIGGAPVWIDVDNADMLTASDLSVTFGGVPGTGLTFNAGVGRIEVTAPRAAVLAEPAAQASVSVRVEDISKVAGDFDEVPYGFTYVGPHVDLVTPNQGETAGGTAITITGYGFDAEGMAISLGGAAVLNLAVTDSETVTGVTSERDLGTVDVTVLTANNFTATGAGLFSYVTARPTITSVTPNIALNTGGETIRLRGSFLPLDADFGSATADLQGYFVNSPTDEQAAARFVWDDSTVDLVTPAGVQADSGVYVRVTIAKAPIYNLRSTTRPFTFVDAAGVDMTVTSLTPDAGPLKGGTAVAIGGNALPPVIGSDVVTGNVFRIGTPVLNGGTLEVPLFLFRGDDVKAQDEFDANGFFTGGPAPAAFNFDVVYDPTVLRFNTSLPVGSDDEGLGIQRSENLRLWYGHAVAPSQPDGVNQGRVRVLFFDSLRARQITTADNVRLSGTPTNEENPFLLATMFFEVIGAQGSSTYLLMENLAAADSGAGGGVQSLEGTKGQSNYFRVGGGSAPMPVVAFGVNAATVDSSFVSPGTLGQPAPRTLNVIAPEGERLGAVDVRVQDPINPNNFAVSTASTGDGYTYLLDGGAFVESVAPKRSWVFGGVVAKLTGEGFRPSGGSRTRVFFGGVQATIAPSDQFTSSSTELYVIVPPQSGLAFQDGKAVVPVTVTNPGAKAGNSVPFTYYKYADRAAAVPGVAGIVTTTAFFFDGASEAGSGDQAIELPGTDGGTIALPKMVDADGTANVFVLVRATTLPELLGTDSITAGDPVEGAWNFDIHAYEGAYPFDEMSVAFDTSVADPQVARLTYPIGDGVALTVGDIETGGVSTYSLDSTLNYTSFESPIYSFDAGSQRYQSTVGPLDYVAAGSDPADAVTQVTSRLATLSAVALRTDAFAPEFEVTAIEPTEGPILGGELVTLRGRGLAWVTSVTFDGKDATSVVGVDDYTVTCLTPPGEEPDVPVDVVVTTAWGPSATLTDAYTYVQTIAFTLTPKVGPVAGGTSVVFDGVGLSAPDGGGDIVVTFGGAPAASITPVSDTELIAVTPPAPGAVPGAVAVSVTAFGGELTVQKGFTYLPEGGSFVTGAVAADGVSPLVDAVNVGDTIGVIGQGLSNVQSITVGGIAAVIVSNTDTLVLFLVPAGLLPGEVYDIEVVTAGDELFTLEEAVVIDDPSITGIFVRSIQPDSAWLIGGVVAKISGLNLRDIDVTFVYQAANGSMVEMPVQKTSGALNGSIQQFIKVPALPFYGDDDAQTISVDVKLTRDVVKKDVDPNYLLIEDGFTYTRWAAEDGVFTTAFYFDGSEGANERRVILGQANKSRSLDLGLAKPNTYPMWPNDADLTFPQLIAAAKPGANTWPLSVASNVYVLARASMDESLFGDDIDFNDLMAGGEATEPEDSWKFDIHLYRYAGGGAQSAGALLYEEYERTLTPAQTPIRLGIPMTNTGVLVGQVRRGEVVLWAAMSDLPSYNTGSVIAATFDGDADVESTVLKQFGGVRELYPADDTLPDSAPVDRVRARIYNVSNAYALRVGPEAGARLDVDEVVNEAGGAVEGSDEGGTVLLIRGTGLGWIDKVEFGNPTGAKAAVPWTASSQVTLGENEFEIRVVVPALADQLRRGTRQPVNIRVTSLTDNQVVTAQNAFTYIGTKQQRGGLLPLLLGLGAALIGLFSGGSGGGGGGPCFIATAAYGTPLAGEVDTLRAFRDSYLLDNAVGTAFVDMYYRFSPYVADLVAKSPLAAAVVRLLLVPVVLLSKLALASPPATLLASFMAAAMVVLRRRLRHKSRS